MAVLEALGERVSKLDEKMPDTESDAATLRTQVSYLLRQTFAVAQKLAEQSDAPFEEHLVDYQTGLEVRVERPATPSQMTPRELNDTLGGARWTGLERNE